MGNEKILYYNGLEPSLLNKTVLLSIQLLSLGCPGLHQSNTDRGKHSKCMQDQCPQTMETDGSDPVTEGFLSSARLRGHVKR